MHSKHKVCNEIFRRYRKAGKKGKCRILDEYSRTLGYNRDYLAHLLANWGKTRYAVISGKPVKYIAESAPKTGPLKAKKGEAGKVLPGLRCPPVRHLGVSRVALREAAGPCSTS